MSLLDQPTSDRVLRTLTCQCLSIHHSPCSVLCQCARRTCRRCALTRQRRTCSLSRTRWKNSSLLVSLECFLIYIFWFPLFFHPHEPHLLTCGLASVIDLDLSHLFTSALKPCPAPCSAGSLSCNPLVFSSDSQCSSFLCML